MLVSKRFYIILSSGSRSSRKVEYKYFWLKFDLSSASSPHFSGKGWAEPASGRNKLCAGEAPPGSRKDGGGHCDHRWCRPCLYVESHRLAGLPGEISSTHEYGPGGFLVLNLNLFFLNILKYISCFWAQLCLYNVPKKISEIFLRVIFCKGV